MISTFMQLECFIVYMQKMILLRAHGALRTSVKPKPRSRATKIGNDVLFAIVRLAPTTKMKYFLTKKMKDLE